VEETKLPREEAAVFSGPSNINGLERPMDAVFPKLHRNYVADLVRSRVLFHKKSGICTPGGFDRPWNSRMAIIA
jgi:hypothetical protein